MRFLHTSDFHLGKDFFIVSLLKDQEKILNQLLRQIKKAETEENPYAALIIAGDVYDRAIPPSDAVELFDWFLTSLNEQFPSLKVFVISGNHDSPVRLNFASTLLKKNNVVITTNVKNFVEPTVLETKGEKCAVYQLPFLAPYSLEQERNQEKLYEIAIGQILENHEKRYADCASVLCAHLYVANSQTTKDSERSVIGTAEQVRQNLFSPFDYVALGHIHSVQKCGRAGNVWYSGSPLGYSFDDTNEKYMLDVQVSQGDVSVAKIPYKPLHKVTRLEVPYSDLCGGHINKALIERHKDDYVQIICTDDIPPVSPMPNIQMVLPNALSFMMKKRDGASGREAEFEKLLNTREADKPEKMIELFLSEANADKEIAPKQKALFMEIAGELQCREQN